jgi:membrane peptidoglycan carboxypeptidase
MLKKLFIFTTIMSFILIASVSGYLYWFVVVEPGDEIQSENIHKILGKESHVFYSDGITKLGVFFDTAHRQYVSYVDIPREFVNAMVASEDNRFFDHFGFDIVGIGRAMLKNIQAGRIVQGGSTLTQQTAKNLFKRTDRSIEAKLKELLFALRLEYYYSKEKIFEFYSNQFYVSGNGHGLGVAARYYFDKTPSELSLVECAFIAGSVKRPNFYNPFIKKTEEASELARSRAKTRLNYVINNMYGLGMIDTSTYNESLNAEIEFKKGQVGYDLDYAMELVREAVSSTEVLEALEAHEVTNIATSGVRIITTIGKELQENTLSILRGELSRLDVRMRGYERSEVQKELAELGYTGDSVLQKGAFLFGTIEKIEGKGKDIRILVALDKQLGQGVIDSKGLSGLVTARLKWQKNRWSEAEKGDQANLVKQLLPGDKVWVSVRDMSANVTVTLDLQKYPEVQGAALILKDGAIKGMAGGTENRFFNRAVHARRQMGSAFKPLVFAAALQLGWNSADNLNNRRNVFVYQRRPYFPRPDHDSPYDWVSMNWAGVHSENLASVWLLSHLCDQLSLQQLIDVADKVGLGPRTIDGEVEPYRSYRARIRDRYGIHVDREVLMATAYRLAIDNLETDFIFDGMMKEYELLKEMPYGLGFEDFSREIDTEIAQQRSTLSESEMNELKLRKSLLSDYYLQFEPLRRELTTYRSLVEPFEGFSLSGVIESSADAASLYVDRQTNQFYFMQSQDMVGSLVHMNQAELHNHLAWMNDEEKIRFWDNIKLNATLTVAAFDKVAEQLEYEYKKLSDELPYSIEVLSQVDDFRISVGLYYLIQLAENLGIKSELDPVLSFPLGSNVVTLLEATRMYEGLVSGNIAMFGDSESEESNDAMAILDRIESADGEILFQPKPYKKQVIDAKVSMAIGNILENVVKFGTGRAASKEVRFQDNDEKTGAEIADLNLSVPLLGKTGTSNNYTNASFFGYLPGVAENGAGMTIGNGYAVGVYVGFDNNSPMRRNSSRISGSAGALPSWNQIANTLLHEQEYAERLDPVDISFYGLAIRRDDLGQMNVGVDPEQGGKVIDPVVQVSDMERNQPSIVTFGKTTDTGRFTLERYFQPFWGSATDVWQ